MPMESINTRVITVIMIVGISFVFVGTPVSADSESIPLESINSGFFSHGDSTEFDIQVVADSEVIQGNTYELEVEVTNEGAVAGSQTLTYEVGSISQETEMYLRPDETDTWYLTVDSDSLSAGEYEQLISSPSDSDDLPLLVKAGEPEFIVGNLRVEKDGETISRIDKGKSAEIHYAILNDGEGLGSQYANCYLAGENVGDKFLELEPSEAADGLSCSFDTSDLPPGTYEYGVESDDDSWYQDIVIEKPPQPPTITDAFPSGTVQLNAGTEEEEQFTVDVEDPDSSYGSLSTNWILDGEDYGSSSQFSVSAQELSPGTHTVEVVVNDNQQETEAASREWTIEVVTPPEIDGRSPQSESIAIDPGESKSFDVSVSDGDTPNSDLDITWEIDGEQVGSGASATLNGDILSSGEHTLIARVSDDTRITDEAHTEWSISSRARPTIQEVTPDRSTVQPGESVEFSVDATDPNYDGISDISWEIGDKEFTGETVQHAFSTVGTYQVTVEVTNEAGLKTSESTEVTAEAISPTVESSGPQPSVVDIGEPVELQAEATDPGDRSLDFTYQWQSDTGLTDDQQSTTIQFHEVGERKINLTVSNKYGATTTRTYTVRVRNDRPTLERRRPTQQTESVTTQETIRFAAFVTNRDASPASVQLEVDGSSVETKQLSSDEQVMSFQHAFSNAGDKTVELSVKDSHGATNKTTWNVTVTGRPPEFRAVSPDESRLSLMSGESYNFEATAVDPEGKDVAYRWSEDGTTIATGSSITETFTEGGTYDIAVEANDPQGNTASQSWAVDVRSFREPPTKNTHLSNIRIDPESEQVTKTFLTASMENPSSNDRTLVVEFIFDTPNGIEVVRQRGVSEANNAQLSGIGRLEPGDQRSMRVGLRLNDKSLIGSDIPINRTIRYYPANQPQDINYIRQSNEEISIHSPGVLSEISSLIDSVLDGFL